MDRTTVTGPGKAARPMFGPLGTTALLAGGLAGLLWLVAAVVAGDTGALDRALLLALRDPADPAIPLGPSWLAEAARDITALGSHSVLLLVGLAAVGYLAVTQRRGVAALLALSIGGGMAASALLKLLFDRDRPDLVPHAVPVFTPGFPSGHAMLSALVWLTLAALMMRAHGGRRVKLYLLTMAVSVTGLVGISRVYLGVHWPTDVLVGWALGAAWAAASWRLTRTLQHRGAVEPESVPPQASA